MLLFLMTYAALYEKVGVYESHRGWWGVVSWRGLLFFRRLHDCVAIGATFTAHYEGWRGVVNWRGYLFFRCLHDSIGIGAAFTAHFEAVFSIDRLMQLRRIVLALRYRTQHVALFVLKVICSWLLEERVLKCKSVFVVARCFLGW